MFDRGHVSLSDVTEAGGVFLWRLKSLHSEGDRSMSIRTACIVLLENMEKQTNKYSSNLVSKWLALKPGLF